MSKNRDFKGIWIPAKIWLSEELTLQEKVFLVEIDSLDNENGCWANNQYFADFFKISKTRVSLIIKSLVDKGYVFTQVDASKGNKRILSTSQTKVKEVIKESLRGSLRKVKEGRKGKLTHNNTENNTSNNTREEEKENPPSFVLANREKVKATKKAYEERVSFKSESLSSEDIQKNMRKFLEERNFPEKMKAYSPYRKLTDKAGFINDFIERNADIETWESESKLLNHMRSSVKFYKPDPTTVTAKAKSIK
jgi:DNA-binding MarR family transcriptional regulator